MVCERIGHTKVFVFVLQVTSDRYFWVVPLGLL